MTLSEFGGLACAAFGPAMAVFALCIAGDSLRIIMVVGAAVVWLMSLLVASCIWWATVELIKLLIDSGLTIDNIGALAFGSVLTALLQEVARYGLYRILRLAEPGLHVFAKERSVYRPDTLIKGRQAMYFDCGFGFGVMSGLFNLVNLLAASAGPGTIGLHSANGHDQQYFFITSAVFTSCLVLLHAFWGVVFFHGVEWRRWWMVGVVVASHLSVSLLSLTHQHGFFSGSLGITALSTLLFGGWAFVRTGGKLRSIITTCCPG